METPQEYYERLRKGGWTEDITGNEYPDYKQPFYQNIFRLMEGYSRLCEGETSNKESVLPIPVVSNPLKAEDPDVPLKDYIEKYYEIVTLDRIYKSKNSDEHITESKLIAQYKRAYKL